MQQNLINSDEQPGRLVGKQLPRQKGLHNKAGKDQGMGFPGLAAGHCSVVITGANGLQHTDKCVL